MKIIAKYLDKNGYDCDVIKARELGLIKDKKYTLKNAEIGQSHSYIEIEGIESAFNSVMFEFYDENGNEIDLMETEYNTYRRIKKYGLN